MRTRQAGNLPVERRVKSDPAFVRIGRIVGAWGLQGHLKLEPLTDFLERFEPGSRLRLGGQWVTVTELRLHKGRPLLKLEGVSTVTQAEALQWEYLEGLADFEPELEEDEFLFKDLVGLMAFDTSGNPIGKVREVLAYPAQDILDIDGKLIPFIREFIHEIDFENGRIVIDAPPELLQGD